MSRILVLLLAVLVAVPVFAPAQGAAPEACRPGVVFRNEDVSVWFHGRKGFVKVFAGNDSTVEEPPAEEPPANETPPESAEDDGPAGSRFAYTTGEIVELDANGSILARLNLERAFPKASDCSVVDDGQVVHMTLTVREGVQGRGAPSEPVEVTFAYHFDKQSRGAKFDLQVGGWPWRGDGTLAYGFDVQSPGATFEPAQNGVGMRDANGTSLGFVQWAPDATAHYPDNHTETASVVSNTTVTGSTARVLLAFTAASPGYVFLDYDPWAGVGAYRITNGTLAPLTPEEEEEEEEEEEPPAALPPLVSDLVRDLLART